MTKIIKYLDILVDSTKKSNYSGLVFQNPKHTDFTLYFGSCDSSAFNFSVDILEKKYDGLILNENKTYAEQKVMNSINISSEEHKELENYFSLIKARPIHPNYESEQSFFLRDNIFVLETSILNIMKGTKIYEINPEYSSFICDSVIISELIKNHECVSRIIYSSF